MTSTPAVKAVVDGLAGTDLDLDRLLTSFHVGYWRVRQPGTGLTIGHHLVHLTRVNAVAYRVACGRATPEQLPAAQRPVPVVTGRPAVLLHNWRRSCAQLRLAMASANDPGIQDWLAQYCEQLRELEGQLAESYQQWAGP